MKGAEVGRIMTETWSCPGCGHRCMILNTMVSPAPGKRKFGDLLLGEIELICARTEAPTHWCPACGQEMRVPDAPALVVISNPKRATP